MIYEIFNVYVPYIHNLKLKPIQTLVKIPSLNFDFRSGKEMLNYPLSGNLEIREIWEYFHFKIFSPRSKKIEKISLNSQNNRSI